MKLEHYSPTSRQILFKKQPPEDTITSGGIVLPAKFLVETHADQFENLRTHEASKPNRLIVVKVGKDCVEALPGDELVLTEGINTVHIPVEEGNYYQVMEQQVIGYFRK